MFRFTFGYFNISFARKKGNEDTKEAKQMGCEWTWRKDSLVWALMGGYLWQKEK